MAHFDPSAVAELERHMSEVASGAPSRFVLVLAEDTGSVAAALSELEKRASAKSLLVTVPPGAAPLAERSLAALLARLSERRGGRPGAAALVDPLVARAAEYVMGPDLSSLQTYLTPEALDDEPAIASRVLVQRFLPALVHSLSVKEDLLEALVRERTGSLDGRPGVSAVLARRSSADALAELGDLARKAGCALVLELGGSLDHAAAPALEAAGSIPRSTGILVMLGVLEGKWVAEASLLSEEERKRVAGFSVRHGNVLEAAPAVAVAAAVSIPVTEPATAKSDRVPLALADAIAPRTKSSRRLAPVAVAAPAAVAPERPLPAVVAGVRAAPVAAARKRSLARKCAAYGFPVVFVASASVFVWRRGPAEPGARSPSLGVIAAEDTSSHGVQRLSPVLAAATPITGPPASQPGVAGTLKNTTRTNGARPQVATLAPQAPVIVYSGPPKQGFTDEQIAAAKQKFEQDFATARDTQTRLFLIQHAGPAVPHEEIARVALAILITAAGADAEARQTRIAVLIQLGAVRDVPAALDRLTDAAIAGSVDERLVALGALTKIASPLPTSARSRIEAVAKSDADATVRAEAQNTLRALR